MPIAIICPKCTVRLTLGDDRAGETLECPKCATSLTVPLMATPAPPPAPRRPNPPPLPAPIPAPLPPPAPAPVPKKPSPPPPEAEEDDDDFDLYRRRRLRRRRQQKLTTIWKAVTLSGLSVSLLCFFLPWVRYSIIVPTNPYIRQEKIEFASQSGLQVTFAMATLHPALDRWVKQELEVKEAELRRQGKNPFNEFMKQNKPYMALWLLFYPLALGVSILTAIISRPTPFACGNIVSWTGLTLFMLLIQFGVVGPPAVNAFYDQIVKEGGAGTALLISLFLDVQYTVWFGLAVLGIVAAAVAQGVMIGIGKAKR